MYTIVRGVEMLGCWQSTCMHFGRNIDYIWPSVGQHVLGRKSDESIAPFVSMTKMSSVQSSHQ